MARFKLQVLVADDASIIHELFAGLAETSTIPFDVIRARDGRECMQALASGRINVAFIDVHMPDMSGMDAVAEARRGGTKTFVALMSATSTTRRLQLARQLRVYEFLEKPFTRIDVEAILTTYCRVTVPSQALIVDDSATVRAIIKRVFATSVFNIDPTEAADGETALAYCEHGRFDVVFLDCNMPDMDGLETLDRLLARDPNVKIIMISAESNEQRRRRALARGATAFLQKPFFANDIDRELHAIFGLKLPALAGVELSPLARIEQTQAVPMQWPP